MTPDRRSIESGKVYEVGHPFVREEFTDFHGKVKPTWRPGVRPEDHYPDRQDRVADGVGAQIITIVSIHKPGEWPRRVFYTRRWRDPDGKEFGKRRCLVRTIGSFRSLISGYRDTVKLGSAPSLLVGAVA